MRCKKVSFIDEAGAQFYIDKLNKTSSRSIKPVRAYLCQKCLAWHLTSIESSENRQLVYKDREIKNLKNKVAALQNKVAELELKIAEIM